MIIFINGTATILRPMLNPLRMIANPDKKSSFALNIKIMEQWIILSPLSFTRPMGEETARLLPYSVVYFIASS